MASSSSIMITNITVVIIVSLVVGMTICSTTSAQDSSYACNAAAFSIDDHRRVCVYHLLDNLLGWTDPVPVGAYYDSYDCGRNTVYGYRFRDDGDVAAACLGTAKDILQNRQCAGRIGGRAWGVGCYMRFEIYPIKIEGQE